MIDVSLSSNMETNLQNMKYNELQKLAKKFGIRANMKYEKLLKALQEFLDENTNCKYFEEGSTTKQSNESNESSTKEAGKRKRTQSESDKIMADGVSNKRQKKVSSCNSSKRKTIDPAQSCEEHTGDTKKTVRRTFDKESSILSTKQSKNTSTVTNPDYKSSTPVSKTVENKTRRNSRNSTINKEKALITCKSEQSPVIKNSMPTAGDNVSPGVQDIISGMTEDMTDRQMKDSLLHALDKRVKQKHNETPNPSDANVSLIPRYTASKKAITPGNKKWQGIHKKEFEKMESIDNYLERKKQRTESMTTSMKKMRMLSQQMRNVVESVKKYRTPPSLLKKSASVLPVKSKASLFQSPSAKPFVPTVTSISKAKFNFGKSPVPKHFVPTVTSTSKANFNFAARRSPRLSGTKTTEKRSSVSKENIRENKANTSLLNKTGSTPFRFTGSLNKSALLNKSQNTSINSKAKFDIKASLSKPLSWKPHKGKLQPFKSESMYAQTHQRKNNTKEQCRKVIQSKRADKRLDLQMKRRGVPL